MSIYMGANNYTIFIIETRKALPNNGRFVCLYTQSKKSFLPLFGKHSAIDIESMRDYVFHELKDNHATIYYYENKEMF